MNELMRKFKLGVMTLMLASCFVGNAQSFDAKTIEQDLKIFDTPMAKSLKKGVKKKAIERIQTPELKALAVSLREGAYNFDFRLATYQAILSPIALGEELRIGNGYSNYENITGVYLSKGQHVILVSNIAEGKKVELVVPNWNRRAPEGIDPTKDPNGWGIAKRSFPLKNGVNVLDVTEWDGLAYIDYYSNEPEKENLIEVHFLTGKVNGYFDISKHTLEDWKRMLDQAVYPIFDARGKHIQVAYPVESFKKYAYEKGIELISNYDSLVYRQHRIMGLVKYGRVPQNRILARVNYNYYMFRDGDGVAYMGVKPGYAMAMVVDPARVVKGDPCWGFSHEVGHVHQLRPYLNYGGLGEVSNNIFSLYVTTSFGNKSRISEQKNYEKARLSIIDNGICYLQDKDVFNRLVPFWQLQLYFAGVGGNSDFYPDLQEVFRNQEPLPGETGQGRGNDMVAEYQLNFVKKACEVSQTDLTDFFEKYGFFWVGEFEMDDYGKYVYRMTPEMVEACKKEIKAMNLPQPKVDISTLED